MELFDEELRALIGGDFYGRGDIRKSEERGRGKLERGIPRKGGRFSISTFSVTTNRLLLCLRGGLPTIGMVSFGPVLRRFKLLARGGVTGPSKPTGCLSCCCSEGASGLTTTIGGAEAARSGAEYLRSGWGMEDEDDDTREDDKVPLVEGWWLLL